MSLSSVGSLNVFHQALSAAVLVVRAALSFSAHSGMTLGCGRTKFGPTAVQALRVSTLPSITIHTGGERFVRRRSIRPTPAAVIAVSTRFILPPTVRYICAAALHGT